MLIREVICVTWLEIYLSSVSFNFKLTIMTHILTIRMDSDFRYRYKVPYDIYNNLPFCTSRVESLAKGSSESVKVASDALSDAEVGVVGAVGESERPRLRERRRPLPLEPLLPEPYGCSRPRPKTITIVLIVNKGS